MSHNPNILSRVTPAQFFLILSLRDAVTKIRFSSKKLFVVITYCKNAEKWTELSMGRPDQAQTLPEPENNLKL